jgi:hypothetical protein
MRQALDDKVFRWLREGKSMNRSRKLGDVEEIFRLF